jgi:hypothetical protein
VVFGFVTVIVLAAVYGSGAGSTSSGLESGLSFTPASVRLNYGTGEMEIRGQLSKPPGSAAPAQIWPR